jgi:hypothetical protein
LILATPANEDSSDADAGVLADYVIALVIADESEDAVKDNCLDSLSDFLQDRGYLLCAPRRWNDC